MIYRKGINTIELYDSVKDLPILRFQAWNKYSMKESDVGSDFGAFSNRVNKVSQYIQKGMKDYALKELENMRLSVFYSMNEYSPKSYSFAILVKNINGKSYENFSPDSLDECLKHLNKIGLTTKESVEKLKEVKKKSNWNWLHTFQVYFRRMATRNKRC